MSGSEDEGDLEGDEENVEERNNDENLSRSLSGECEKSIKLAYSPSFHLWFWRLRITDFRLVTTTTSFLLLLALQLASRKHD